MLKNIKSKNKNSKNQRKKELKTHASNSLTTLKNIETSKKLSKNIKNNKQKKSNEKKSLNISAKIVKSISKEKDKEQQNKLNSVIHRKKTIHKQASFISKISTENLQSTIDNDYIDKKNCEKKLGRQLSMRSSDIKIKKFNDKKIDIEKYLKEIKLNKQKTKTKSSKLNTKVNFSIELSKNKINPKKNKHILNTNLSSFSPIEKTKNKKIYHISSKSKSKSKSKKHTSSQTNPNNNKTKEINHNKKKKEENLSKNVSETNLLIKDKGVLKPFCYMINITNNNKIKEGKNNVNYSSSNENNSNYVFDKDKYFKDFKDRINNNIQKKKWKSIISKNNYLSEENKNNIKEEKSQNSKKKKIKSISIMNNGINKCEELSEEDLIFKNINMNIKKNKIKKNSNIMNNSNNNRANYSNIYLIKKKINNNNINNINNQGRNASNNIEPKLTEIQKNNKNDLSNTNFNLMTQTGQDKKSLTINTNNNENKKHVIKSGRNKKSNKTFRTQNSNINKNNYLKIASLYDKLKKYKNGKKIKKGNLEIKTNINTTNTNTNNNYIDNTTVIDENKIKENLANNTLTMYSIYILSKYYQNCDKIGLTKIIPFDNKGNNIPVIYYNTNYNLNNRQKIGISSLFNYTKINDENISNNFSLFECNTKDIPFIIEFKNNLYINFYIKKIYSENIEYIQINNYCDIKNKICPVRHIEIYKSNELIYNGILNELNIINKIFLNKNNNNKNNSVINTNKNTRILNYIKQRPLSSSKPRSNIETQNTKTSTYRKSEVDEYYKKRNVFKKSFKKNFILIENKENINNNKLKLDYYKKQNEFFYNGLSKKCSGNDIRNTKLLTGNLKREINISNTYTINNMTSNIYDIQKTQKIFYISSQNNNINTTDESNIISRIKDNTQINPYDTNIKNKNNDEKIFIRSNSEKKFKKNLIKTQKSILFQKINEENSKDYRNNKYINIYNNINYYSNNISINENTNQLQLNKNFIEFNKIRFLLTSNYGHKKFIGLTGIEFYDIKYELINIEKASSVGALPKDLKTIFNDNDEVRIFENVFNNFNNTNDIENMWVTKFNKISPFSFIEIYFEEKIKISKIKIFNYNQKEKLDICVKTIDIYLDDKFFKKISLRQGTGECAYDFLDNNNLKNNNKENSFISFEKKISYDFGQLIKFPILNEEKNISKSISKNNDKIKFASELYEQCYETPYLPYGGIIKFQFINNYYKGISLKDELDLLKYNDIGVDKIEIFDEEGNNLNLNYKNNNYKIISNCEMLHNDENKIILNGIHNENNENSVFFVFEKNVQISYIKFYPLMKKENDKEIKSLNSLQKIKIFCDNNIIFEGNLYLYHPTIILFTSDSNIIKDINEKYLTKNIKNREYKEIFNENNISLVFH